MGGWQTWALLSAVFAALTAVLAKLGVDEIPPNLATLLRTLVVVGVLGLLVLATGEHRGWRAISPRGAAFLAASGLATGASWLCYFRALRLGTASQVAPLDKLSVVLVAVLGALFLGERLSDTGWLGIALITVGAVLVAVR
ncbi:MAG: EamA family transporter [Ectothiorhodospiraceae bacterium]|nr:EamA family transporter [Ectothiorhodospiraceae bacterium]